MVYGQTKMKKRKKNYLCKLLPYQRHPCVSVQEAKQICDWGLKLLNIPSNWTDTDGEGVKVAVLDTGCDLDHPDIKDNLLSGKNFVDPSKDPFDDSGHGTHVTGIICAENNDIGVVGVAPKTKVIPIKVLDENGNGNLLDVAKGIRWAVEQKVDFITMSLGSPEPIQEVRKAIKFAKENGIVTFCAAGNAGPTHEIFYPANYPETIGIGSIDSDFKRANFSCTGNDLDFLAPGVKIYSTIPKSSYGILSGTSMSTPFVVGIASLLLSYKRNKKLKIELNCAEDYRKIFKKHVMSIKNKEMAGKKFFEGFGIIDTKSIKSWIEQHKLI